MKLKFLAVIVPLALAGCAPGMVGPINVDVEKEHAEMGHLMDLAHQAKPADVRKTPAIERVSGLWLPSRKMASSEIKVPLNEALARKITVNRTFSNIQDMSERITALTGIPVIVSPEAGVPVTTSATGTPPPGQAIPNLPPLPGVPGRMPSHGIPGMPGASVSLAYNGTLSGFLDVASARYGVFWEWNDNKVRFFRTATKTFRLSALPGDTTLSAKISNQSGGSSGSGGASSAGGTSASSSQEAGVSFTGLSVWKGIEDAIKTMLTTSGTTPGKVVVTASTGTVTVTDTPQVLAQVEKFIDQQNISLCRQVVVNVRVLAVDLSDSDNYGINWNIVYNSLSQNFGWTLNNAFAPEVGASSLALKILGTAGTATNSNIKSWAGSEAMIDALSKQGRVSQITSASVTTLNNQPAPIQVGRQTSYLASSTTTIGTAGAPSITTLQPGLITTGFSMNLVPHMLDGGRLLLQYAVDLSSLLNIATVTSGGSSIQTPEIETRNFLQRVMLNSGDTLVVTGFEQSNQSGNMQGVGSASNTALGGGVKGSKNKTVLVILIQPVIAN